MKDSNDKAAPTAEQIEKWEKEAVAYWPSTHDTDQEARAARLGYLTARHTAFQEYHDPPPVVPSTEAGPWWEKHQGDGTIAIVEDNTKLEFSSAGNIVCFAPTEWEMSMDHWQRRRDLILRAPQLEKELQEANANVKYWRQESYKNRFAEDELTANYLQALTFLEAFKKDSPDISAFLNGDAKYELPSRRKTEVEQQLQEARALLADCERFAAAAPAYPGKYELQKRIVAALASSTSKESHDPSR